MTKEKALLPPVRLISDRPVTDSLLFGFDAYAETLSGMIANKENATPLVMGIHGPGGAGKTTLMKAIKTRLDSDALSDGKRYRRCKTVWLQAWKYEHENQILTAIIETIFKAMAADGFFSLARAKVETVIRRIDKSAIFASLSGLISGVDISEFFSGLQHKARLGHFDTFQKFLDDMIWTFLNWRFKLSGQEKPDDKKGAFVIFIDDIDRCVPEGIVALLKTIQLFMYRPGCICVLAGAGETIRRAWDQEYGSARTRDCLKKIFQLEFTLPRIPASDLLDLVEDKKNQLHLIKEFLPVIGPAIDCNPRHFKRFVNNLNLLYGLLRSSGSRMGFDQVQLWAVLVCAFSGLASHIEDNPDDLYALKNQIRRLEGRTGDKSIWLMTAEQLDEEKVPPGLHAYLQTRYLADIVARLDVAPDDMEMLRKLSSSLEAD